MLLGNEVVSLVVDMLIGQPVFCEGKKSAIFAVLSIKSYTFVIQIATLILEQ